MAKNIFIVILVILVVYGGYCVVRPLFHSSKDQVKILMCGQSTMALWFKHWNWPYPLRIKTTYKPWPIPYHKYARGKLYLEYFQVANPKSKDPNVPFGERMLKFLEEGLGRDKYDAVFFKFCFVDFPIKENGWQARFDNLTNTIIKAHEITSRRNIRLIVGNALPLPEPNDATLRLQKEYNNWLERFGSEHDDVFVFDLFGPLTDQKGRFKMNLAHAKNDHHPGERAFSLLDKGFFEQVEDWLTK